MDHSLAINGPISFLSLVALAVSAQAHCALMCGPLASTLRRPMRYTLGRIISYGVLGALVGWLGTGARLSPTLSIVFALLATSVVIFSVLKRPLGVSLSLGPSVSWISRITTSALRTLSRVGPFALGLGTPLLPCGQLWAVMGFAGLSGNPMLGAAIGSGFALISTPAVLSFGLAKNLIDSLAKKRGRWVQTAATAILVLFVCSASAEFVWTSYRLKQQGSSLGTTDSKAMCQ